MSEEMMVMVEGLTRYIPFLLSRESAIGMLVVGHGLDRSLARRLELPAKVERIPQ